MAIHALKIHHHKLFFTRDQQDFPITRYSSLLQAPDHTSYPYTQAETDDRRCRVRFFRPVPALLDDYAGDYCRRVFEEHKDSDISRFASFWNTEINANERLQRLQRRVW